MIGKNVTRSNERGALSDEFEKRKNKAQKFGVGKCC